MRPGYFILLGILAGWVALFGYILGFNEDLAIACIFPAAIAVKFIVLMRRGTSE